MSEIMHPENELVVVWASRHTPLKCELHELHRIITEKFRVKSYRIVPVRRVSTAEKLAEFVREVGAKIVVAVLPLTVIQRLAELQAQHGFILLKPHMKEIGKYTNEADALREEAENRDCRTIQRYWGDTGTEYKVWEFQYFEHVKKVVVEAEPIGGNHEGGGATRGD